MAAQPLRVIGRKPTECPECDGVGYTQYTAPTLRHDKKGKLFTFKQGSGCPVCLGLGQVESLPLMENVA